MPDDEKTIDELVAQCRRLKDRFAALSFDKAWRARIRTRFLAWCKFHGVYRDEDLPWSSDEDGPVNDDVFTAWWGFKEAHLMVALGIGTELAELDDLEYLEEIGAVAYTTYRDSAGGKSLATGDPLPDWEGLPDEIRMSWKVAAMAVRARG